MLTHPQRLLALIGIVLASVTAARAQEPSAENYLLAPNDLVQIKVFQEDDLATTTRVSSDGAIIVPLIGTVRVGGTSVHAAAELLRQRLKKGFLVNPQVNVTVLEFAKRRFTVIGQVQKGGTYNFPDLGALDLLQAIGMAGGYTRIANAAKVTVRRTVEGREVTFKLDAKEMGAGGMKPFAILPGDVITVGESFF